MDCNMVRKSTKAEFIAKARAVHGDRYDYSDSEYVGSAAKIIIRCSEHGEFEQIARNHLTGFGCLKCGQSKAGQYHKKDTNLFIAEARGVHGDAYDYGKTVYRGAREKLVVTCPKHGDFEQVAFVHLRATPGEACLACSYENRGERQQLTLHEFLQKALELHGEKYDYSRLTEVFAGANKMVPIVCPVHGDFEQLPINHLLGKGCSKCGKGRMADAQRKSTDDFIADALKVHGNRYDYSQTEYKGAFDLITIICPIDGPFEQSPTSHLAGIGCARCSRRLQGAPRNLVRAVRGEFDDAKSSYVYVVTFQLPGIDRTLFKVGTGTGSRLSSTLTSIMRVGGAILDTFKLNLSSTGEAIVFEQLAHQQIREAQFPVPRDLKFAGHSEVFTCMPDLTMVEQHEILLRFRSGERWTMKRVAKATWR